MSSITTTALKQQQASDPNLVLIDVRTEGEVSEGMIPGAVWMDLSHKEFMANVLALPKEKNYCLYCASGGRSTMAVSFMEQHDFTHVVDLEGGIMTWISQDGEVVLAA